MCHIYFIVLVTLNSYKIHTRHDTFWTRISIKGLIETRLKMKKRKYLQKLKFMQSNSVTMVRNAFVRMPSEL